MKKKLIILTFLSALISILIYYYTKSDNITFVSLGDSLSLGMTPYNIKGYSFNDYLKQDFETKHILNKYYFEFSQPKITIQELIYEIKDNKTLTINNEDITIQRAINEADILTLAIGIDEISTKPINSEFRHNFTSQLNELFTLIRKLNHKKVLILSLYSTPIHDELTIAKLNAIIRDVSLNNNFIFIDINNILNKTEHFPSNSYYPNYLGHKAIYQELKKYIF